MLLQILNGGGEVASAHAELDGDVAASAFVIDHEGSVAEGDVGDGAEGNLIAVGSGDEDSADGLGRVAELRRVANGEVEAAVAVDDLRDGRAADGGLHDVVDVLRLEAEARGFGAVDGDEQAGLAGRR